MTEKENPLEKFFTAKEANLIFKMCDRQMDRLLIHDGEEYQLLNSVIEKFNRLAAGEMLDYEGEV